MVALLVSGAGCSVPGSSARSLRPLPHPVAPAVIAGSPRVAIATTRSRSTTAVARRAVRRYFAVVNHLPRAMDPAALAALMTTDCPCRAQVHAIARAAAQHEHYVDHARVNALRASVDGPALVDVLADVTITRGGLRSASGAVISTVAARAHLRRDFRLVRVHGRWLIDRIEAV